jgi:hypothetical protein
VERINRAMRAIEDRYDDAYSFGTHQRHFRNARLVEESAPEAEGVRIAMDLMRSGRARDLREEIEELSAEDIVRGINSLGQPRILVFGPDLGR